ncbi:MAG: hypothetical protein JXB33_01485 [Clostridia bacterium]|nr:hypothetical protein [Clostridia bacterium]
MKLPRIIIAISIIVVLFGGIAASKALGVWATSASRNISGGQGNQNEASSGEEHDSLEISGSTTIGQALEMGVPEEVLIQYFGDIGDRNAVIKDLSAKYGLSFGKVKSALNIYIDSE